MKLRIISGAILCMLLVLGGAAYANEYWDFYVKYKCVNWYNTEGQAVAFQIDPRSTVGQDGEAMITLNSNNPGVVMAIHKTNGVDGWNGDTGYYRGDQRPLLTPGQTIAFNDVFVWAQPGTPVGNMGFVPLAAGIEPWLTYKLLLVSVPTGITYSGPTEWMITSANPTHDWVVLPYYATADPSTGYRFRAEVTAVPEPSSMAGLLGAIASLGGAIVAYRRRK